MHLATHGRTAGTHSQGYKKLDLEAVIRRLPLSSPRPGTCSRIRGDGWISGLGGQDRVLGGALPGGEGRAGVFVAGVFGGDQQALPFGQLVGEGAALGGQAGDPLAEPRDLLSRGQDELGALFLGGGRGLGGARPWP